MKITHISLRKLIRGGLSSEDYKYKPLEILRRSLTQALEISGRLLNISQRKLITVGLP